MDFVIRRAAYGLLLLGGVSLLSFLLSQCAPGDFFQDLRLDPRISAQTIEALRSDSGADRPLAFRYYDWLMSAVHGDFGYSLAYHRPVAELLRPRMFNTLLIALPATLLSWLIAVPLGVWTAVRRGAWSDRVAAAGTSVLLAVPDLVLALALSLLAVRTGYFPPGGMTSANLARSGWPAQAHDVMLHMILPVIALTLSTLPMLVRHVRAGMIEALDAPFVRTAIACGIPRARILWRHVFPAAVNPLISLLGFSIGTLLSTALVIEVVMGWPGLGPLVLEAILARDLNVVVGAVLMSTAFLLSGNLAADLLLFAADPRIRRGKR